MSTRRRLLALVATAAAIVAGAGAAVSLGPALEQLDAAGDPATVATPPGPVVVTDPDTQSGTVPEYAAGAAAAAALPIIEQTSTIPAYERDEFGSAWADIDANGCNQRQDVLVRDLVDTTVDADGCTVLTGTLFDPYTATDVTFAHDRVGGDSQAVSIDHVVSLSAAWAGGAWAWTDEQRLQFANDLDHLIAVDGPTNAAKSDSGPAEWMPPNGAYACAYALQYTTIVTDAGLAVAVADREALLATLTGCAA